MTPPAAELLRPHKPTEARSYPKIDFDRPEIMRQE
jgi:hypothetical protein